MFEKNIQRSWEDYSKDFGLGRVTLFICFFNCFLVFLGILLFERVIYEAAIPIVLSFFIFFLKDKIISKGDGFLFFISVSFFTFCIILNYYYVGLYDQLSGGFKRYDAYFSLLDEYMFGTQVAIFFKSFFEPLGSIQTLFYDFFQLSYISYFLFPFFGGFFYYRQLNDRNRYVVGRYLGSIVIFFMINYLFYMLVPISGPQYTIESVKQLDLPLSSFGLYINELVYESHPNFIDCFPSGHTGVACLVTIWMFRIKNHYRYIFLFFCLGMIMATLALKYHFFLDVICALPFALICYKLGYLLIPTSVIQRSPTKWRY